MLVKIYSLDLQLYLSSYMYLVKFFCSEVISVWVSVYWMHQVIEHWSVKLS